MDFSQLSRVLAILGVILLLLAGGIYLLARLNVPLGKLPGDLIVTKGNFTCAVPLVSGLLVSIILTIVINLLIIFIKK